MRRFESGYKVQLANFDETVVEDGRVYVVTDDGELVVGTGRSEVARFAPGSWVAIRRLGVALREEWPPSDFDYVMARLGERLVVGYGLDFRYGNERFRDPLFNDFNALVDALLVLEGGTSGFDSDYRRWIVEAVTDAFGVEEPGSGV